MKFLNNLELRLYQQAILGTASLHNVLCVIPTGLGKTFIAVGLASLLYKKGKILIMAPTKPLCVQHSKTFSKFFEAEDEEMVVMTGEVSPETRKKLWQTSQVFFATPQTVENDIMRRYLDLEEFSLFVFDEAHRATGDYAYVWIAEQYNKTKNARILALTASPASEKAHLQEIRKNLSIERVEVRTTDDADVSPYIQKKEIEKVEIEIPAQLRDIIKSLEALLKQRLASLKQADVINSADPSKVRKVELLRMQAGLSAQTDVNPNAYLYLSIIAECLKLQHALEVLQTQGVSPLIDFFKKLEKQSRKVKASKRLVTDWGFKKVMTLAYNFWGEQGEHPKFDVLKDLVLKHKGERMIIFTQYRSTVKKIVAMLSDLPGVLPRDFIGQAKGMSQKEQVAVLKNFRDGKYNVLVTTSVGEEGIDIPSVPVGIFFEPVPSALRSIQRRGRAGRTDISKIYVLVAKDTIDEKYYWVAKHKERRMNELLDELKDELAGRQATLGDF